MLNLPKSTEFNKRIPKQKFYENLDISPAIKRVFVEQIKIIYWANKVAASTTNLAPGETVNEVEFFEIKLNSVPLDENVLRLIDREIPYHIVFVLEYENKYQLWTSYKEASAGNKAFKVSSYYHTEWIDKSNIPIKIDGLSIDKVYENFVRQIAGDALQSSDDKAESLKESVERDERRKQLQKQIDTLQTKMRREKQLNKQMEINKDIRALQKELEEISNG